MRVTLKTTEILAIEELLKQTDVTDGDVLHISDGEIVLSSKENIPIVYTRRTLNAPEEFWTIGK